MKHNPTIGIILAWVGTGLSSAQPVEWRVVQTKFSSPDIVVAGYSVLEFGAKRDGSMDDTPAFNAALIRMGEEGGGTVFVPAGSYAIRGNLVVPSNVTLRGEWSKPAGKPAGGTILMAHAGRGDAKGAPFILLRRSAAVKDLTVWYPEQNPAQIVPYPWCILQEKGGPVLVERVTLVNPYRGVSKSPDSGGLLTIKSVYGSPLFTGIELDMVSDIPRLENVFFSPDYWSQSGLAGAPAANGPHAAWMRQNGTGLRSARVDWIYAAFGEIAGYRTGIELTPSVRGATSGKIYGFNVHDCQTAILVNDVHETGLLLTACTFDGDIGIKATDSFTSALLCHSCVIRGSSAAAMLDGAGTSATLFQDCSFEGTVTRRSDSASFLHCAFSSPGDHLVLEPEVNAVTLAGCSFAGPKRLINRSKSPFVKISDDPLPASMMPAVAYPGSRTCQPAKAQLFVVNVGGDGKKGSARDDTAAIQSRLREAGNKGGGIVLLPAGTYRVRGTLVIPEGVELRGVNNGPHDTATRGSVLALYAGRGATQGEPAIAMKARSGLRGVLCYYPEQKAGAIVPYPPTIQGQGANVYVLDVTGMNPYWFADFSTFRCDNHYLDYLAGSPVGVGVSVGSGAVNGEVRNCQFVTHFWTASPFAENRATHAQLIGYKKAHVEGFVIGSCTHELLFENFVFGSHIGLHFNADDGAGADALVFGHGSDNAVIGVRFDAAVPAGVRLIDTELAVSGAKSMFVELGRNFPSTARFFNSRLAANPDLSVSVPSGALYFELGYLPQYGSFQADGGQISLVNLYLKASRTGSPEIMLSGGGTAKTTGCITGGLRIGGGKARSQYDTQHGEPLPRDAREIGTTLGERQDSRGLVMARRAPSMRCVLVEKGGRKAWASAVHPDKNPDIYYMTLSVDHAGFKNGGAPKVKIAIDYFDEGTGNFGVVYDSSDQTFKQKPDVPGAWKVAGQFNLKNTGQWKTYECTVRDALFTGRCNSNDIRFNIRSGTAPAVSAVRITRLDSD